MPYLAKGGRQNKTLLDCSRLKGGCYQQVLFVCRLLRIQKAPDIAGGFCKTSIELQRKCMSNATNLEREHKCKQFKTTILLTHMIYQFNYSTSRFGFDTAVSDYRAAAVIFKVQMSHEEGNHRIDSVHYLGVDVMNLLFILSPKTLTEIKQVGIREHFRNPQHLAVNGLVDKQ